MNNIHQWPGISLLPNNLTLTQPIIPAEWICFNLVAADLHRQKDSMLFLHRFGCEEVHANPQSVSLF